MAIVAVPAILSFTDVGSFTLQRSTNILRSRYTGQAQKVSYPYAIWMFEGTLREYDGADAGIIRSFLVQLDGQKNEFRLPVPGHTKPTTGYIAQHNTSIAAAARATSITVSGGANNAPYLNEGDFFTINDELKIVTAAIAFNGAGQATISFKPPLRKAVIVGTPVIVNNPTCLMQATDDDIASWGLKPPVRQQSKFGAIEAVSI